MNAPSTDDTTPLHLAASQGHLFALSTLLTSGASPSARNIAGMTPKDVAKMTRSCGRYDAIMSPLVSVVTLVFSAMVSVDDIDIVFLLAFDGILGGGYM